jgi:hypothetical protein
MTDTPTREHFVPLRKADLLELLCRQPDLTTDDQVGLRQVYRLLEATFHFQYHALLETLKAAYAPFDPDADVSRLDPPSSTDEQRSLDTLFENFSDLLERANFRRLSRADILEALDAMSDWGLRLDVSFEVFERLEVFARGDSTTIRRRRRWQDRFRVREIEVPVYQRLVVIFRLRPHKRLGGNADTRAVFLKIFKEIPRQDLEMLLPGSRVRMSYLDTAKVWLPTVSGLTMTVWKLLQGALTVAAAGIAGLLAVLGLLVGALGYSAKSLMGYLRTKEKHQLTLTQSLYYRNLDNNAGVLFRLLDEAEEQECREALLAYYFLWRHAGRDGWMQADLDDAVERFLSSVLGRVVDFEVQDALRKLQRLRIVEEGPDQRLHAVPPAAALAELDSAWDAVFDHPPGRGTASIHAA